jgi:hypothetical protein
MPLWLPDALIERRTCHPWIKSERLKTTVPSRMRGVRDRYM